jgi:hypothetical protein
MKSPPRRRDRQRRGAHKLGEAPSGSIRFSPYVRNRSLWGQFIALLPVYGGDAKALPRVQGPNKAMADRHATEEYARFLVRLKKDDVQRIRH